MLCRSYAYIFDSKQEKLKSTKKENPQKQGLVNKQQEVDEHSIDKELNELIKRNESFKIGISKIIKEIEKTKTK